LNENDVAQVRPGQTAQVRVDAYPQLDLTGTVTAIAATEKVQSGVVLYPVTVAVAQAPDGIILRSGMTAETEIIMDVRTAIKAPLAALRTENGQTVVQRKVTQAADQGGAATETPVSRLGFETVPVTVGLTVGGEVEILSGLAAGDIVSVANTAGTAASTAQSTAGLPARPAGGLFGGAVSR
jgi:hypothetical protein